MNARPSISKFACSPDPQKVPASEHHGISHAKLSRDNIQLGDESH